MTNICPYKEHIPEIGEGTYIDSTAKVIGEVALGQDVSVWPIAAIRGDVGKIHVGDRTNIQDSVVLHASPDCEFYPGGQPLIIGEDVTIGHRAILHGCEIGNFCLIGMGAIILDGVKVEKRVIIGAGSLVPSDKHLDSGYLYFGSPVKKIRALTEQEQQLLKFSSDYYVNLKNQYL